ncbi:hypothetical protein EDEG_02440 [Edhazardia aedis USNM 41457]|uniref:40S ribosomal protein S25 n=1 Tax=Edhazardia aedis (strain USNM 41457) TaxID=1003232 RepID=J9DPC1_EDHAE|nr:hypothetical protein EDEG_02440 [Edhazardia aedis USNM 41457]|eukprot:EJW03187.1 hypothetical protein EDEG_02440 [Edhazardia aedis USNM 41457]
MAKKAPVSKAAQLLKAQQSGNKGSKKLKSKASTGKVKKAVQRSVSCDENLFKKIQKEILNNPVVTKSTVAEKYNLCVGVAQKILDHLFELGKLNLVSNHGMVKIYSKVSAVGAPAESA